MTQHDSPWKLDPCPLIVPRQDTRWEEILDGMRLHESAHAVIARVFGIRAHSINMDRTDASGFVYFEKFKAMPTWPKMVILMAGGFGMIHRYGVNEPLDKRACSHDVAAVAEIARKATRTREEANALIEKATVEAARLVRENWEMIHRVADALKTTDKLSAGEIDAIVADSLHRQRPSAGSYARLCIARSGSAALDDRALGEEAIQRAALPPASIPRRMKVVVADRIVGEIDVGIDGAARAIDGSGHAIGKFPNAAEAARAIPA